MSDSKDFSKLKDSKEGRAARQKKRRDQLNEIAKESGFDSWAKLETFALNNPRSLRIVRPGREVF